MCVFKYHAFIFSIRPPRWQSETLPSEILQKGGPFHMLIGQHSSKCIRGYCNLLANLSQGVRGYWQPSGELLHIRLYKVSEGMGNILTISSDDFGNLCKRKCLSECCQISSFPLPEGLEYHTILCQGVLSALWNRFRWYWITSRYICERVAH